MKSSIPTGAHKTTKNRFARRNTDSSRQVIEPRSAVLAPVALPMPLGLIMTMTDHRGTGTARAANSFRPSMMPDQLITLGVIDQGSQIDHLRRSHGRYRLRDDAGHHSNQEPSREAMICYRTWVRWSHPPAPPSAPRNPG